MTILVELDPETEALLKAQAEARGIGLEQHVSQLVEEAAASRSTGTGKLTREGLRAMTKRLQEGSERLPVLPPEATDRASFYQDRW